MKYKLYPPFQRSSRLLVCPGLKGQHVDPVSGFHLIFVSFSLYRLTFIMSLLSLEANLCFLFCWFQDGESIRCQQVWLFACFYTLSVSCCLSNQVGLSQFFFFISLFRLRGTILWTYIALNIKWILLVTLALRLDETCSSSYWCFAVSC